MCCERKIALVCERRRLSGMVVTKRKQHAPVGVGTRQVGALDRIAGTIDTGPLPYHMANTPSNAATRHEVELLTGSKNSRRS